MAAGGDAKGEHRPRIVYLAPSDIQVARVDRQCIVSFCSALKGLGVDVELVAVGIRVLDEELRAADALDLYRIRHRFPIRTIRVPVHQTSGAAWLAANRLPVHALAIMRALARVRREAVSRPAAWPSQTHRHGRSAGAVASDTRGRVAFYTKTYSTGLLLLAVRRVFGSRVLVVFEPHLPPNGRLQRFVLARADRVVANTHALAHDLVVSGHVARHRVLGMHQGVDLELVEELRVPKRQARDRLGLPVDKKLAVYTGKINVTHPEVDLILEAARALEDREDIEFVLVGGRKDHVRRLRERVAHEGPRNVRFTGFVAPAAVQDYQFAADALVLYYPSRLELNAYRSPGKLFEYMASGNPTVSVDLPVLREVLGDPPAAALVPADAPGLLAAKLVRVLDDEDWARDLAQAARQRVAAFTWAERARLVMEFIENPAPGGRAAATQLLRSAG